MKSIIIILIAFMTVTTMALAYVVYDVHQKHDRILAQMTEVKAKVGSLVRDINANSSNDFVVNTAQNVAINDLKNRVKT